MTKPFKVECGHIIDRRKNDISTGYAIDPDGKRICYNCALKEDKEYMRKHGVIFAYMSKNKKSNQIHNWKIINWPGKIISDRVYILRQMVDNFGGERTYFRFVFEGEIWSGFGLGNGMYCRARRTKLKHLYA